MTARLLEALRRAPSIPLLVVGAGVLAWFALHQGGQSPLVWAPGGLVLLGLLAVGIAVLLPRLRGVPRLTVLAGALLAGYCAWSYASVGWATEQGAAWEGANRTLVYLAAFVLFALWRQTPASAGVVLGVLVASVAGATASIVIRLARTDDARPLLPTGRLQDPTGYVNATAALLLMTAVVALCAAASPHVWWWLRGLSGAALVLLADGALMAVSRGSLLALPVTLAVLLLVAPERLRRIAVVVPAALAVGLAARPILDLASLLEGYPAPAGAPAAHHVAQLVLAGAGVVGLVVALVALLEHRRSPSAAVAHRVHRVSGVLVGAALAVALVVATVVVGSPRDELDGAWSSFKQGYGENTGTRLTSGLGSDRYKFYVVALRQFDAHPVIGVGADNFFVDFLREGEGGETPHYPHSIELRTLGQTGLVGALLLFGAFAAAAPGAVRAARQRGTAGGALAAGAATAVVYWLVHGSADWFFEYAGLGTIAFALLGLATALDPARTAAALDPVKADAAPVRSARRPRVLACAGAALLAAAALALLGPFWASEVQLDRAGEQFARQPDRALGRLARARQLNPFTARPDDVAGSISIRLGDLAGARHGFEAALERLPDDQYATLQLAAVVSALGNRPRALALARRASALAPRDATARDVFAVLRSGDGIDVVALQRRLLAASDLRSNG